MLLSNGAHQRAVDQLQNLRYFRDARSFLYSLDDDTLALIGWLGADLCGEAVRIQRERGVPVPDGSLPAIPTSSLRVARRPTPPGSAA